MVETRLPLGPMRAFEAVARHLSFQKAAEELHLTPSALSFQVRRLEAILDMRLFDRGRRGLTLTREGHRLAPGFTSGFTAFEEATGQVSTRPDPNLLVVNINRSLASCWLVQRLSGFTARHPEIRIRLINYTEAVQLYDTDRDVDLVPPEYSEVPREWYREPLFDRYALPLLSPTLWERCDQSGDPKLFREFRLICDMNASLYGSTGWQDYFHALGLSRDHANVSVNTTNADLAQALAVANVGIVLGRLTMALPLVRSGELIAPFQHVLHKPERVEFVSSPEKVELPKVARFLRWLREEAARDSALIEEFLRGRNVIQIPDRGSSISAADRSD